MSERIPTINDCFLHGRYDGDRCPRCAHVSRDSAQRLIRLLTADEMARLPLMGGDCCCWRECGDPVMFRLATPLGGMDFCDAHIDAAIAELPSDWIGQWEVRETLAAPPSDDGIPF